MMKPLFYTLHVWTELHIGSGVGLPGVVDELAVRDHENLAYIPGSTVKGLVRDSCRQLLQMAGGWADVCAGQRDWFEGRDNAAGFCAHSGRQPLCVMCQLFGSAGSPSAVWFSPAAYAPEYRTDVVVRAGESAAWRDMGSSAHAAIDPQTRRAKSGHLFNLEVVRPSEAFRGRVDFLGELGANGPAQSDPLAWLGASLLFTRRLGGRRRRGWGRCWFELAADVPESANAQALAALDRWSGGQTDGSD